MRRRFHFTALTCAFALLCLPVVIAGAVARNPDANVALERSVAQLRACIGNWTVRTDFLGADGSVARSTTGTYEFHWVVPDRVAAGTARLPALEQTTGILFYVSEAERKIEMVAVGSDGHLWVMTGALGEEVRTSQEFTTAAGGTGRLRFTRSNVTANSFESVMEQTEDGGETWSPGNHQYFRRSS